MSCCVPYRRYRELRDLDKGASEGSSARTPMYVVCRGLGEEHSQSFEQEQEQERSTLPSDSCTSQVFTVFIYTFISFTSTEIST